MLLGLFAAFPCTADKVQSRDYCLENTRQFLARIRAKYGTGLLQLTGTD